MKYNNNNNDDNYDGDVVKENAHQMKESNYTVHHFIPVGLVRMHAALLKQHAVIDLAMSVFKDHLKLFFDFTRSPL